MLMPMLAIALVTAIALPTCTKVLGPVVQSIVNLTEVVSQ